jgi:hypothetical protein
MDDLSDLVMRSSKLITANDFSAAEALLAASLKEPWSKDEQVILLQQLMHVHTASGDLGRAQLVTEDRERLDPSAPTALSNAYFQLYGKGNSQVARVWVRLAIQRAANEDDPFTLYNAHCLAGLLAVRAEDWDAAGESLAALRSLADDRTTENLSWGDAVLFLEAVPPEAGDIYESGIEFASRIASKIEDADFRDRANPISKRT